MFSFIKSTRGDFNYIRASFLIECKLAGRLLDPTPYLIEVDRSKFIKNSQENLSQFTQKQRALTREEIYQNTRHPHNNTNNVRRVRPNYFTLYRRRMRQEQRQLNSARRDTTAGRRILGRRVEWVHFVRQFYAANHHGHRIQRRPVRDHRSTNNYRMATQCPNVTLGNLWRTRNGKYTYYIQASVKVV